MDDKPYSAACERNREPILEVLRRVFADRRRVLEVGSGTGQHAVHFAAAMTHLVWQCSDRAEYLDGIRAWLAEAQLPNTPAPLAFDVNADWLQLRAAAPASAAVKFDAIFTSNTLHIMSWPEVQRFFAQLSGVCSDDAKLAVYGPFNYGGQFTSASNASFDADLRADAAHRGIRDFEAVNALAHSAGFMLREDCALPANNRCVIWQRGM